MLLEYRHLESLSLAVIVGERENSKQPDTRQSAWFGLNHVKNKNEGWGSMLPRPSDERAYFRKPYLP